MDVDHGLPSSPADAGMKLPPGVVANATYQGPAPMLPHIPIPLTNMYVASATRNRREAMQQRQPRQPAAGSDMFSPRQENIAPPCDGMELSMKYASVLGLTRAQIRQITGGFRFSQYPDQFGHWAYEKRREAQAILPFLYLGPSAAARDRTFLQKAGITKMIAVRDSRLADARLLMVEHIAKEMGIQSECIDVSNLGDLLRALPAAVNSVNQHMLNDVPVDSNGISTGKVLVFCETGNVRAPPLVAAYLMSMCDMDMLGSLQFLCQMRFCISLDEDAKHMLVAFSDLLNAKCDVAEAAQMDTTDNDTLMEDEVGSHTIRESVETLGTGLPQTHGAALQDRLTNIDPNAASRFLDVPSARAMLTQRSRSQSRPAKRSVEETMDDEDDRIAGASQYSGSREPSAEPTRLNLDMARYQDRKQFVPFVDTDDK